MGNRPSSSVRIFWAAWSIPNHSLPLSARPGAVTSPTYPVPITAIFKRGDSCTRTRLGQAPVLFLVILQVLPAAHARDPVGVLGVPLHRVAQPLLERHLWPPAQLALDL